jgi:hypothetical protein
MFVIDKRWQSPDVCGPWQRASKVEYASAREARVAAYELKSETPGRQFRVREVNCGKNSVASE